MNDLKIHRNPPIINLNFNPKIIETESEYEDYEEKSYSLDEWSKLAPHEILKHLLESSGRQPKDLAEVINIDHEHILAIIKGQKVITENQAKQLGTYFKVSPNLFI